MQDYFFSFLFDLMYCVCFVVQVLYLTEPIDEVAIQNLAEYGDKKFVDVSREGIDLGADDEDSKQKVSMQPVLISASSYSLSFSSFGFHLVLLRSVTV